jgi:hypothetical protein
MESFFLLLLAGGAGALIKEILEDNKIKLPNIKDGMLDLGFLGALLIGGFVGYAIDGSYLTAAMAGFVGFSAIQNLVPGAVKVKNSEEPNTEEIIRTIAKNECVDPELCVKVAKCESSLNTQAVNTNTDGTRDRGLYQINEKYHPEVTDAQAFDPVFATQFFCKAFKGGNLSWWNASRKCWEK